MSSYTESIEKLIEKLVKFPGIGRRSAERIVGYILSASRQDISDLAAAISKVKESVRFCRVCNNLSEREECVVCSNPGRRKDIVCIVEQARDVTALEKASKFNGVYHVLMGSISPLEGRGPADLKLDGLIGRLKQNNIKEIIIATDADTEGETTALYVTKLLKPFGVRISRIGLGLPVGSHLEYADPATLSKALEARRDI